MAPASNFQQLARIGTNIGCIRLNNRIAVYQGIDGRMRSTKRVEEALLIFWRGKFLCCFSATIARPWLMRRKSLSSTKSRKKLSGECGEVKSYENLIWKTGLPDSSSAILMSTNLNHHWPSSGTRLRCCNKRLLQRRLPGGTPHLLRVAVSAHQRSAGRPSGFRGGWFENISIDVGDHYRIANSLVPSSPDQRQKTTARSLKSCPTTIGSATPSTLPNDRIPRTYFMRRRLAEE
jgi:hypothetical protein